MSRAVLQSVFSFGGKSTQSFSKRHRLVDTTYATQRSFSSSNPTDEPKVVEAESASEESSETTTTTTFKQPVFPWRHDENLLPRLVQGTIDYETRNQLLSTTKMVPGNKTVNALASAFMFLDVPLYQFFFFGSWKAELADSVSWAFTQGLASVLSKSTAVPINEIINDTYELTFRKIIGGPTKPDNIEEKTGKEASKEDVPSLSLESIIDEKLLSLYQSAKDNWSEETELCLQTVPYSAELISLYAVPYVSRQNTKADPALLRFYRGMMNKESMERSGDLNKLRRDYLDTGRMESTIIAQVVVWCNEIFYVKDVGSGKVLQGSDDEETSRNVPHLVRMEMTVKTTKNEQSGNFSNNQGEWIITDIDDVLDGNLIV